MSNNHITRTAQDVNTAEVWSDPSRTVNGITITAYWEESEGAYLCLQSPGKTVNRAELGQLITAMTELMQEVGE